MDLLASIASILPCSQKRGRIEDPPITYDPTLRLPETPQTKSRSLTSFVEATQNQKSRDSPSTAAENAALDNSGKLSLYSSPLIISVY